MRAIAYAILGSGSAIAAAIIFTSDRTPMDSPMGLLLLGVVFALGYFLMMLSANFTKKGLVCLVVA